MTPWGKIHHPTFERQNVAVFLFPVHCFCGDFGMQEDSMLVSFPKSKMLVLIFFLKMKMRRASLVDNALDMLAVFLVHVRRDLGKDCSRISCFAHIFSHEKTYYHGRVESIVDGTSGSLVNSLAGDFRLFSVIEPRKFK